MRINSNDRKRNKKERRFVERQNRICMHVDNFTCGEF